MFSQIETRKGYSPDIFEYVYFARPDSIIDGISVLRARKEMGYLLAKTIKSELTAEELASIDVVIPIPETAVPSGKCVAESLGKPYEDGFCKSRYTFRTFILSGQKNRESSVKRKLAPIDIEFRGRTVLLVDDSIVRGTTSREIVNLAKGAGAKKIYFASCAPRITHPHIYGIDLASPSELIAHHRDNASIARHLGAEKVIFQTLPDLKEACKRARTVEADEPADFEVGVFCGKYCTPVDDGYLEHLDQLRGETKKTKDLDDAKDAVVSGLADDAQRSLVERGAKAKGQEVVPSSPASTRKEASDDTSTRWPKPGLGASPNDRMDISLHNFGDHE
jgi:amidophosphoribosyltransferase